MTKKIQRIMTKQGLTQRQLARDLGVTETWISLVLHRKGKSRRILREIAKRTGIRLQDLLHSYADALDEKMVTRNPSYRKAA